MKNFITLFKINLNLNFGISALKYRYTKEGKTKWEPFLIGAGILAGAAPLLALYTLLLTAVYMAGNAAGQPEMVLTMSFLLAQVFILIFGIFYVMGSFYFSNDLNTLIPMPLKPYEVLGSKMLVVMVNEYITAIPLLLPSLIIYGAGTGQGIYFWIKGLILILTAPAIPLVIGALFIVLLMRFVNLRRSKDLLAIIGGFLGILVALGINVLFSNIPKGNEQDYLNNLLAQNAGLVKALGNKFPPSLWATFGLSKPGLEGLGYFLLFIGVSILLFAVLLWLGNLVFYKSILAGQEVTRKRKKMSAQEMNKHYEKVSNPVRAIYSREWKMLLRTPVYVLNGLAGVIFGPFLVIFTFIMKKSNSEEIRAMGDLFNNPDYAPYIALAGLALMIFTAGMSIVPSTSVSREGQTFWIAKLIPVSAREQVLGKFYNGFAVSVMSVVVVAVIMVLFFGIAIQRIFMITLIALLASVLMNAVGLILDILHPKLVWKSTTEAMKQNVNGMLSILFTMIYGGLLAIPTVVLSIAGAKEWLVYLVLIILTAGPSIPAVIGMMSLADRQYAKLEA